MPHATHLSIRPTILDYCLLLLLATLWGASYTFIKVGVATIPPVTFIAARTLIAGLLLLAIIWLRGVRLPTDRRSWWQFAFQACMNSVVPFTLIAWAELTVDAGLAAILNSTSPIFTFLFTFLITRHEPAPARKFLGVAAGLAGIALIIGFDAFGGLGTHFVAELAIILATICYAVAAIFGRRFHGLDPMAPAAGSLTWSVPACAAQPRGRPAMDPGPVSGIGCRSVRPGDLLHGASIRHLLPPVEIARLSGRHQPGLSARPDRGRYRRYLSGRDTRSCRFLRPRAGRHRRGGDDLANEIAPA